MKPAAATAFAKTADFRAWLERHHASETELFVRCYKTRARHLGIGYREALDEALCYGWIDGVRHALDADSFSVRFTPRRPKSVWSAVNVRRVRQLEALRRMRPSGLAASRSRPARSAGYSYQSRPRELSPAELKKFRARRRAWTFFEAQPPWYRRTAAFWVMSAKREETRARRLRVLIDSSERRRPIPPLTRATGGAAKRR